MLLFWLTLFGLIGVSLLTFLVPVSAGRRSRVPGRAVYALPPADWPDVPIDTLRLFDRTGRINDLPLPQKEPPCVACFADAQDVLMSHIANGSGAQPVITMRLSPKDAAWTEVLLDGMVVVRLPTSELTAPANFRARAA